jgi:thiazole synthase
MAGSSDITASSDSLVIDGVTLRSRLFLGTAGYPSLEILGRAIEAAQPGLLTVSLRRESAAGKGQGFWNAVKAHGVPVLPNTAGCYGVAEAVTTAQMAREIFETHWIKLEVIGDDYTLQPDPYNLLKAAEELTHLGFKIFPYMTDDLILAQRLSDLGCDILMPWGAPIGSGRGLNNVYALELLRSRFPSSTLVVDAGLGAPSHAAAAMELGYDAVLLNTAVAKAGDPALMAKGFADAVAAGRAGYLGGIIAPQEQASPSTPLLDRPFWHQDEKRKA